jgi:hypothetical protein
MNFNFGDVLSRALQITWKHKVMWLGGIIITLFSFIIGFLPNFFLNPFFGSGNVESLTRIEQEPWFFILIIGIVLLTVIITIPLTVIGLTIPVAGTLRVEKGEERLTFGSLLRESLHYFLRVLGAFAVIALGIFLLMIVFMGCIGALSAITFGFGMILILPFYCVLIIFTLLVYAYGVQVQVAILADNLGVVEAIQKGWSIFKGNFLGLALLCVVIYFGTWLVNMIISLPMMIPMYVNMFRFMESPGNLDTFERNFMSGIWIWFLVFAPVYSLVQGIVLTFMQSAWTVTYLRITRGSEILTSPDAPAFVEPNA